MPKIKFLQIQCSHCHTEYKVRLERIGESFECLSCGDQVETNEYIDLVKMSNRYSEIILDIESKASVEGDVLVPKNI